MPPKSMLFQEHTARNRLIAQNIKLRKQINNLQEKMSHVITTDITLALAKSNPNKSIGRGMHDELAIQQSYIKKLKNKINQLKSVNQIQGEGGNLAIKQANDLKVLKKQYEKLLIQKQVRQKQIQQKKIALQDNNPIKSYRNETTLQLAKVKKDNALKQAKIIQLQREVRKLHQCKQLYRQFKNQKIIIQNPEYDLAKLEHEKVSIQKKIKAIQNKWKPQIDSLDKQYFSTRQIIDRKQKIVNQLHKELNNWQNRVSAVRDEADVLRDRERISKVSQSPHKQLLPIQEIEMGRTVPKKKPQVIKKKEKVSKSKVKQINNAQKAIQLSLIQEQKQQPPLRKPSKYRQVGIQVSMEKQEKRRKWDSMNLSKYESQSERIQTKKHEAICNQTRRSVKNQFMNSKNAFSGIDAISVPDAEIQNAKKNRLMLMKNVGVGTSFYYNQDDD